MTKQSSAAAPLYGGRYYRYYRDICLMAVPLVCMAWFYYGPRPALMCAAAMLVGNLCDRLVCILRRRRYQPQDLSNESFALVIALLLPASCSWYVLVVAVVSGVLIGKEVFGGFGSYPFHPAAVGYVVAAVSWPNQVFRYPVPGTVLPLGSTSGVTLVSGISNTLRTGGLPSTDTMDMLLGNYAGPMGTTAILVLLACALFLLLRRDIGLYAPLSFVAVCAAIAFFFPRQGVLDGTAVWETVSARLNIVKYELCSGALCFGAVFLLNEPFTSPRRHRLGRVLYGALLGALAMGFRYFGAYETGICFALLGVNSVSEWLDILVEKLYRLLTRRGGKANEPKGGEADAT